MPTKDLTPISDADLDLVAGGDDFDSGGGYDYGASYSDSGYSGGGDSDSSSDSSGSESYSSSDSGSSDSDSSESYSGSADSSSTDSIGSTDSDGSTESYNADSFTGSEGTNSVTGGAETESLGSDPIASTGDNDALAGSAETGSDQLGSDASADPLTEASSDPLTTDSTDDLLHNASDTTDSTDDLLHNASDTTDSADDLLHNASDTTTTDALAGATAEYDSGLPGTSLTNIPDRTEYTGNPEYTIANTPTPGATYQEGVTAEQIQTTLDQQAAYARYQWANNMGVVGPTGSEMTGIYAGYNNSQDPNYAMYQQFAYHHDLQSADAQMQNGWFYSVTNATSAARGMDVLQATGDVNRALDTARREWASSGFTVRQRY